MYVLGFYFEHLSIYFYIFTIEVVILRALALPSLAMFARSSSHCCINCGSFSMGYVGVLGRFNTLCILGCVC